MLDIHIHGKYKFKPPFSFKSYLIYILVHFVLMCTHLATLQFDFSNVL